MPIIMQMFWEGIKPEQYEILNSASNFDSNPPKGAIFHTAAFNKKGMHVVDLWENENDFNSFVAKRLMPEVNRLGVKEPPQVQIHTVYSSFVPGYEKIKSKIKQAT